MVNKENLKKALDELNAFKKRKSKYNYYTFDRANDLFDIFFSIGTRTTGKTSAVQRDIVLTNFLRDGSMFVKLCRNKEDLKPDFQKGWWTSYVIDTLNKHDIHITYKSGKYYINEHSKYIDETGEFLEGQFIREGELIGYVVPVLRQQNYKSLNYERCSSVIFDEFALVSEYSYDFKELEHFKSLLSTIVRLRDDVKVYLIGNVLSPQNPYFEDFGINAMNLKRGKMYAFTDSSYYAEPCRVGLEYGESVTENIEDIPRLLRIKGNEQVTGMDMYQLPIEVIGENDFLISVLERKDRKIFDYFYDVVGGVMISIDNSKRLRFNNNLDRYEFKNIKYYIIRDKNNDVYYFIAKDKRTDYGLSLDLVDDVYFYKYDTDPRNNRAPLPDKIIKGKHIYGDLDIYRIFERGL